MTGALAASSMLQHTADSAVATVGSAMQMLRDRLPPSEARILLGHVLDWPHARVAAHPEQILSPGQIRQLADLAERRVQGEPMAYLTGWREFYGRMFRVGPAVLIPRPETELLVDFARDRLHAAATPGVLDLGTGSGVLAITLALELPGTRITAVERSAEALELARDNARMLGAEIRFIQSDWFSALADEPFDMIVANPPYVAAADPHLSQGDLRFEPAEALSDGSADGLDSIRSIVGRAKAHLRPGGWLAFEHGYDQAVRCRTLLEQGGFVDVATRQDLANIDRVTFGRSPNA